MKPVRIGIIGVGIIGKQHLELYSKISGVEVVAACDIKEAELNKVADRFRIENLYTNFREMLKRDDLDAVDVCLHNNLHAPVTIEVLKSGKHAYCEKPIAGSYFDGKAMLEAAKKYGKMLHIQLAKLYSRETKAAKHLIENGELGNIYHARSVGYRRRGRPYVDGYGAAEFVNKETAGGGALFDMGVYHISQLLYLMGMPKVDRISGKVYQQTDMDPGRRQISKYNVEEIGMGFVRFEKGITMDVLESWAIHMNSFDGSFLAGSKGGVRLEPFGFYSTLHDMTMSSTFDLQEDNWRWHQLRENEDVLDSSQQHWVAVLQGRTELLPTAEIALQTMLISEGIYLSDRLGREVTADEVLALSKSMSLRRQQLPDNQEILYDEVTID